jgi:hypothetical protein
MMPTLMTSEPAAYTPEGSTPARVAAVAAAALVFRKSRRSLGWEVFIAESLLE